MRIGDRVYDKHINANGYVLDVDENAQAAEVQYFWGFHSNLWFHRTRAMWHTETADKRRWAEISDLIKTPMPTIKKNTVGMFGKRILNTRIKLLAELPAYNYGDVCDIVIRYGIRPQDWRMDGVELVLNHNLTINKWDQCVKLKDLVPDVLAAPATEMDGDWIVKPHYSVGGKGIEDWTGNNHHGKYLQRKIIKDREFRAHGFLWAKDKVPLIQEKTIFDKSQLCWNMKKGGSFHYCHQPVRGVEKLDADLVKRITDMSVDALKRLKYDMGGVDLCLDTDGELYILEVNSYWGQREMTMASTKTTFAELWNLDIAEYKRTRWLPKYRPILEQMAPATVLLPDLPDERVSEIIAEECEDMALTQRASATQVLKGAAEAYLLEAKEEGRPVKLSELEDLVTPEERKRMLAAAMKVSINYNYNKGRRD